MPQAPPMSLHYLLPMSLRHSPKAATWRPWTKAHVFQCLLPRPPKTAKLCHPKAGGTVWPRREHFAAPGRRRKPLATTAQRLPVS